MTFLEYKTYTGSIEYSREDDLLYGKVLGIKGLLSYEGKTGNELEHNFKEVVDIYLTDCKKENILPEKPFKGSFNVRVSPNLHQRASLLARENKLSLNSFIAESIKEKIDRVSHK